MTSPVTQAKLWFWQRASAMVLAVGVLAHLAVMIYAVRGGLSAAEILSRTHGSRLFGTLYTLLVLACAVHVPLGLVAIVQEWLGWRGPKVMIGAALFSVVIAIMGLRTVYGVVVA